MVINHVSKSWGPILQDTLRFPWSQAPCSAVAWAKVPYLLEGQAPAIFLWCRPTAQSFWKKHRFSWKDSGGKTWYQSGTNVACVVFVQTIFGKFKLIVKFHCESCCQGSDSIQLLLGLWFYCSLPPETQGENSLSTPPRKDQQSVITICLGDPCWIWEVQ